MQTIKVKDADRGIAKAKSLLYKYCNNQTALFLSGGLTPKTLYELLVTEKKLKIGSAAIVDERFGLPMHQDSNEKMIEDSGFFKYLKSINIPVFKILNGQNIEDSVKDYEKIVLQLLNYKQKIAILGIGEDGHTAGIPAGNYSSKDLVISINDFPSKFNERITLTFTALGKMDKLILLVFGENKKQALNQMFEKGTIEKLPARFYVQKISKKTILITDQKI